MKKAAIAIENIIIAVLIASAIFGFVFVESMNIADELINYDDAVIDQNNYGALINGNTTNLKNELDSFDNTKSIASNITLSFENLKPSFSPDGLTSIYTLAWNVIGLIKNSMVNLITMIEVSAQVMGIDPGFMVLFSTVIIVMFLISAMWLIMGRST